VLGSVIIFCVRLIKEELDREECIGRFDSAHGFAHQDILGRRKGLLMKPQFIGDDYDKVIEYAIAHYKANFRYYETLFEAN
jgi:hypothetical protein